MEGGINRSLDLVPFTLYWYPVIPGMPGTPLVPGLPERPRGPDKPVMGNKKDKEDGLFYLIKFTLTPYLLRANIPILYLPYCFRRLLNDVKFN